MNQTHAMVIGILGLLGMALLGHFSPKMDFSLRGSRGELAAEDARPAQTAAPLSREQR